MRWSAQKCASQRLPTSIEALFAAVARTLSLDGLVCAMAAGAEKETASASPCCYRHLYLGSGARMTIEIVSDRVPQTCGTRTSREFLGELLGQRVSRRVRYLIDVLLHLVPRLRFSFVFAVLQLLDLLDVMPAMRQ